SSAQLKTAHKIFKESCRVDWERSIEKIHNHIRGLSPYPGAWTTLHFNDGQEMSLKIFGATIARHAHNDSIGSLSVGKKELLVAVDGGDLSLTEIQLPNKRKMKIHEALNGISIPKNAFVR
ncbi:MAG: methionyl-tRNA formyltransferase, partial [Flavobacteriaceae bacterium]